jgi:hypothetical protein
MVALLSRFRRGDAVRIDAREEFYAYVDGWRGRVVAVGPCAPNAVHSQVPEGYCAVECEGGKVLLVPHDQLAFDL